MLCGEQKKYMFPPVFYSFVPVIFGYRLKCVLMYLGISRAIDTKFLSDDPIDE